MSGGHINYLQHKDAEDIITNSDLLAEVDYVSTKLAEYGEVGTLAIAKNNAALAKLRHLRDEMTKLDAELSPLRAVWRAIDYRGTNDMSDDDVRNVLQRFNETNKE